MNNKVYLKPSIKVEPLIWSWYAWSYLIPPHTAACNIVNRHLKIMQSFVQAPQVHAQAVKNPKLLGGPFVDLPISNVEKIQDLIRATEDECTNLIALEAAIKRFDKFLLENARGDAMEALYQQLPAEIKGMVELVYDLNCHPQIRFIETLFYHKYYTDNYQSVAISDTSSDFRNFVLSTPRLDNDEAVTLNLAFADKRLDDLFKAKYAAVDLSTLQELLEIPSDKLDLFASFFTEKRPELSLSREYKGNDVRVRYLGHACVLLQTQEVSILIDPVVSYNIQSDIPRYTFEDLPDQIDYVLITHNHQDHVLFEMLLQLRHKIKNIVIPTNNKGSLMDPCLKTIFNKLGFAKVFILNEFESLSIPGGEITGLPFLGEHSDLNIHSKLAHHINLLGKKFIFAADSNNIDMALYEHVFDYIGKIDVLFIGMECDGAPLTWLYGPLLSSTLNRQYDNNRNLSGSDANKAWDIVIKSGCNQAYVYAMGQEPWLNFLMALKYEADSIQITESNKFVQQCQEHGIVAERLYSMKEFEV